MLKTYEVSYTLDMEHIQSEVVSAPKKVEAMVEVMVKFGEKCIVTDIKEKGTINDEHRAD
jgi:hypothetical protein